MTKLKVSFDPEVVWNQESYREVLQSIMWEPEMYDLYLITKTSDNAPIVAQLGMNPANVFEGLPDNAAIVTQLDLLKIAIHLSPTMVQCVLINETSVDTVAILVDSKQDIYNIQPKWFQQLKFWVNRLSTSGKEEC
jgi:hypothetical protein